MLALMKTVWRNWKRAVHGLNAAISFTLMAFVYWAAVFPVAMGFKLFKPDALDRGAGDPNAATEWKPMADGRHDVRHSQRPW